MSTIEIANSLVDKYAWLSPFTSSLDDRLKATIEKAAAAVDPDQYDPFEITGLLSSAGELLDRCLSYRREYEELSARAVLAATDYEHFNNIRAKQQVLDEAQWLVRARQLEASGGRYSATAFRTRGEDGFATVSDGIVTLNDVLAETEESRIEIVRDRWEIEAGHQALLKEQHETVGHVLNFRERAARALKFLEEDLGEAVRKLLTARKGIFQHMGARAAGDDGFPGYSLDDVVFWTRDRISALELAFARLSETRYVGSVSKPEVGKSYTFDIGQGSGKARALYFEASLRVDSSSWNEFGRDLYCCATFATPGREGAGLFYRPRTFVLDHIGIQAPGIAPARYDGRAIRNIDPIGEWKLTFETMDHPGTDRRETAWINELKVTVVVARDMFA